MTEIKEDIFRWARENAKLSTEEAAHKLGFKDSLKSTAVEKVMALENGERDVSRALLFKMAQQYRVPLLTFYLDRPPKIGDRGKDFRTLPGTFGKKESANVDVLIRDIRARQSTIRETLIDSDEEIRLEFIGKHTVESGVITVVDTIREVLGLDLAEFRRQKSIKAVFQYLRQQVEAAGVFVVLNGNLGSHHTNISVEAFRGYSISDDIAPLILINDHDAKSAWSFTLMHEMTHLILGQTGISGVNNKLKVEQFCNDVASELLLPQVEFERFRIANNNFDDLVAEISEFAKYKRLSSSHIAYRLYKRGDINRPLWGHLREFFREQWLESQKQARRKDKSQPGGPSYYVIKNYKLGSLVGLVRRMTSSGVLTTTKAGMLLGVRPIKVHRVFQVKQPA